MSKFKVGDEVLVNDLIFLPNSDYTKDRVFTIVAYHEDDGPILDTGDDGWTDYDLGSSHYWHCDEEHMTLVLKTTKIGGEII